MTLRLALVIALFVLTMSPWAAVADLNVGLTARYTFNGNANDITGNGNNGIEHGAPTFVPGIDGQAVSLDGIDDYIELPASLMENDFSVAFFVKTTAIAPNGSIWFLGLSLVDGEVCGNPPGGDAGIAMIDGGHVIYRTLKSTAQINDGAWHSVVVTRTLLSEVMIFIDGVLSASATGEGDPGPITGITFVGVGNSPCNVSFDRQWFAGQIDLRFYDRILSVPDIQEFTQLGRRAQAPALQPWMLLALSIALMVLGYGYSSRSRARR